jgi:hypothetical protein
MELKNQNYDENFNLNRFCPACGSRVQHNGVYCSSCGFKAGGVAEEKETAENYQNQSQDSKGETSQIIPVVKYADLGERFLALLIDGLIISALMSLIGFSIGFGGWTRNTLNVLVGFLYFVLFETRNNGQTLGKMAIHIRTVGSNGNSITPAQTAIHVVGKVFFLPIDVFLGLITKDRHPSDYHKYRISQNISNTSVIKVN